MERETGVVANEAEKEYKRFASAYLERTGPVLNRIRGARRSGRR